MQKERAAFHYDREMLRRLKRHSQRTGIPQAEIARRSLGEYLDRSEVVAPELRGAMR